MCIYQMIIAFIQWQTARKFINSFYAAAHLFSPHFIWCLSSVWCFHHNKLGIEPRSWHLALACYIVPLIILQFSSLIFISFYLFLFLFSKRAVKINDFWKWTYLMKQFSLWLLGIWALALKKRDWTSWTLCGKAENNPESENLGSEQGWLRTLALPFSRKQNLEKTDSLAQRHVREVEQWYQLPDEPCWLFSQWSEKHVKIIHTHMLGLKIVCTVDPFRRNMQPVFSIHLGESSNDWKLFVAWNTHEV